MGRIDFEKLAKKAEKDLQDITGEIREWVDKKSFRYPTTKQVMDAVEFEGAPIKLLYYLFLYGEITDEEEVLRYHRLLDISNSTNVYQSQSIKDSDRVYKSYNVTNSTIVRSSEYVNDSEDVKCSTFVEDSIEVEFSKDVRNSEEVSYSSRVYNSMCVNMSENVSNSKFIYTGRGNDDCLFCRDCKNLKHSIFCALIKADDEAAPNEYYIFNTKVSPEEFARVKEGFNMFREFFSKKDYFKRCSTTDYKELRALKEYCETLPGYNEPMFNFIFDKARESRI